MSANENLPSTENKPLNFGQKFVAGVLILAAAVVLFIGLRRFKTSVKAPFTRRTTSSNTNQNTNTSAADNDILALQNKDSDEDGLSDYDELYVYQTSPYIADSDSDGIDDKVEIERGDNPNCPVDKNCGINDPDIVEKAGRAADNQDIDNDPFNLNNLGDLSGLEDLVSGSAAETDNVSSLLPDDLSVDEIKELLRQAGMPDNLLDQFTDEQLVKAYQSTLENMKRK